MSLSSPKGRSFSVPGSDGIPPQLRRRAAWAVRSGPAKDPEPGREKKSSPCSSMYIFLLEDGVNLGRHPIYKIETDLLRLKGLDRSLGPLYKLQLSLQRSLTSNPPLFERLHRSSAPPSRPICPSDQAKQLSVQLNQSLQGYGARGPR